MAKAWAAIPFFLALIPVLRLVPSSPRSLYKVEILRDQLSDLNVYDVNELPNSDWRPKTFHAVPLEDLSERAAWFRIKIPHAKVDFPREYVTDVGFYPLRNVDFYLMQGKHLIKWSSMGLDASEGGGQAKGLGYNFALHSSQEKELTLLVRIATRGFLVAPITIVDRTTFDKFNQIRALTTAGLIGSAIGLFLFNAFLYISLRYRAYIYNSMFQLAVVLFSLLGTGCFSVIWPNFTIKFDSMIRLLADLVLVALIMQTQFLGRLMDTKGSLPISDRSLGLARFAAVIVVFAAPILPLSFMIVVTVGYLVLTVFQYNAFKLFRSKLQSSYFYNFAIRGAAIAGVISVAAWSGYIPSNIHIDTMYIWGLIWAGLFFSVAVAARVRELHSGNLSAQETIRANGPKSRLNAILRDDFRDRKNASDVNVSIMFIDMVSFAQIADALESGAVLNKLTRRLDEMTKVIHSFGGTVDRSVGDGIICFFGGGSGAKNNRHVVDAYNAALKIQHDTVASARRIYERYGLEADDFPLPVRIGIHTDQVTIGNLGSDQLVDLTMVGSGVSFASQLETACAPFKIMISESSRQCLITEGIDSETFQSIMFSVKHKSDLVRGYEANPFVSDPDALTLAMKMYRNQLSGSQRQERVRPDGQPKIALFGPSGSFKVIDFSPGGFQCVSNVFLAQKSVVDLRLETNNPELDALLNDKFMRELTVEVRWSRRSGREFLHGMKVLGANEHQLKLLNDTLVKATSEQPLPFVTMEIAS
jgi:class 3 adenylate cyclase